MKKKGARSIPDFSSKKKGPTAGGVPVRQPSSVVQPRERVIKPQSTSSKGGRRGQ
jgi:hypothetical protein